MAPLPHPRARRPPAARLSLYLVVVVALSAAALITGDGGEAVAGHAPPGPVTRAQLQDCLSARGIAARARGRDELVAPVAGAALVLRVHPSEAAALAAVGPRTVSLPGAAIRVAPVDNNVSWRPAGGLSVGAYAGLSACFDPPPSATWRAAVPRLD